MPIRRSRSAGKHVMTCFVQYVPYKLRQGTWDENRELLGDRVVKKIAEYAPNVPNAIIARQVLTPLDLERTYGLTEGNIFHGDLISNSYSSIVPLPDGRNTALRSPACTCAAPARIPAAASPAPPATTARTRSFAI